MLKTFATIANIETRKSAIAIIVVVLAAFVGRTSDYSIWTDSSTDEVIGSNGG